MQILRAAGHHAVPAREPHLHREHRRVQDVSVGTHGIPVGGMDGRLPHTERVS